VQNGNIFKLSSPWQAIGHPNWVKAAEMTVEIIQHYGNVYVIINNISIIIIIDR
jgi:hypothetical protein